MTPGVEMVRVVCAKCGERPAATVRRDDDGGLTYRTEFHRIPLKVARVMQAAMTDKEVEVDDETLEEIDTAVNVYGSLEVAARVYGVNPSKKIASRRVSHEEVLSTSVADHDIPVYCTVHGPIGFTTSTAMISAAALGSLGIPKVVACVTR